MTPALPPTVDDAIVPVATLVPVPDAIPPVCIPVPTPILVTITLVPLPTALELCPTTGVETGTGTGADGIAIAVLLTPADAAGLPFALRRA